MRAAQLPRPVLVIAAAVGAVAAPAPAGATTPAIQVDPAPIEHEVLGPSPQGATIGLLYWFGIGRGAGGDARASVTGVVERPGCVLDVRFSTGAAEVRGQVEAGAPLTLRHGAAGPTAASLAVDEGPRAQPACVGAPVGVAFGTTPGDRPVPFGSVPAFGSPAKAAPASFVTVSYSARSRRTTLRASRALGEPGRTYAVRITRSGATHATGTLRGSTLRLTTAGTRARPLGRFTLRAARGAGPGASVPATPITLTR
jgi:hypothetical protein